MQIQAGRDGSFHKRLTQAVLTEDNQRDGTFNARTSPRVFPNGMVRRANQRRLAHVSSRRRNRAYLSRQMVAEARSIVDIPPSMETRVEWMILKKPSKSIHNGTAALAERGLITLGMKHAKVKFIASLNHHSDLGSAGSKISMPVRGSVFDFQKRRR